MPVLTPARQALKLLVLRDAVRAELGSAYAEHTQSFRPAVISAINKFGCPVRAAAHVVAQLKTHSGDIAAQRLVLCAALDIALDETAEAA